MSIRLGQQTTTACLTTSGLRVSYFVWNLVIECLVLVGKDHIVDSHWETYSRTRPCLIDSQCIREDVFLAGIQFPCFIPGRTDSRDWAVMSDTQFYKIINTSSTQQQQLTRWPKRYSQITKKVTIAEVWSSNSLNQVLWGINETVKPAWSMEYDTSELFISRRLHDIVKKISALSLTHNFPSLVSTKPSMTKEK